MKLCTICNEIVPAGQACARSDCPNKASTTASPATPKIEPGFTGKSDQTVQSGLDRASDAARDATRKIVFLLLVVCVVVLVAYLVSTRNQSGTRSDEASGAMSAGTMLRAPDAVGIEVLKYVTSQANIRNIATAQGPDSRVVGTLRRGEQVRGMMRRGLSGDSYWFQLADGRGFVSAVNLSDGPPGPETANVRPPIPNATYCSVATKSGNLRIRSAPGGAVVGAMPQGSRFQAFDEQYDRAGYIWVHIQPTDPRYPVGWVLSDYIFC